MFRLNYLILVFVLLTKNIETGVPEKISLTVYYESLCPDSKNFIVNELQPALQRLYPYFELRFIAFGKAQSIDETSFECQHGPSECLGNMVQSCALHLMREAGASDLEMLNYVVCEMKLKAAAEESLRCVKKTYLNEDLVTSCLSSGMGTKLLLHNEQLTNYLRPSFIPTITIGNTFNQQFQDSAMQDLTGTLCSYFKDMPPCAHYYNDMVMKQVL